MAKIFKPTYSEVMNAGEQRLIDFLEVKLPDDYAVICNGEYAQRNRNGVVQYFEYDCIVVAPHAIFHLENKDWGGKLEGNDDFWYVNDSERKNPLKTAQFKSRILKSKLVVQDPDWRRCEVIAAITLSNPHQSKYYFDPHALCFNQTFLLDQELIDFITDADRFHKPENCIADIQQKVVDFLSGASSERSHAQRTRILEYEIDEVLQRTEDYSEYLCHHLMIDDGKKKLIREYPLDKAGLSPMQLEEWQNKVKNALYAQSEIGHNPYIIPSEYRCNSELTFLYEISDYMRHNTLRSIMKLNKDMTVVDKFKIILNVANALKAIAEKGVFHRDICPENIYVTGSDNAAIANFGKAYFAKHHDKKFTVKSMLASESSPYRPPEFSDDDVCDSSDVYSLGVVIYELFMGKTPYPDTFSFRSHGGKVTDDLLPSHISESLPKFLDTIIQHTVVEDLEERWNAEELIEFITQELYRTTGNNHKAGEQPAKKEVGLKDLKPGDKITGSLVLYEELGAGAFGRVFKAKNTLVDKYYAVKLFERSADAIDDTRNEFLALSKISHPNVVKIWNCDISQQGLFYTQMDLLDGENLRDYTKGDVKLPLNEIFNLAHSILSALVYMQDLVPPIFHRDIKPNNIVWHKREKFVLIDFNISAASGNSAFAGTYAYMAPDLVISSDKYDWDSSADTFSLGVTLFELLAHALPWTGTNPIPKLNVPATNISTYRSDLSDAFEEFLMKSIITDKTKRFSNAKEMLEALEKIGIDGVARTQGKVEYYNSNQEQEDIVDYINSLYSQSEHGNGGTRSNSSQNRFDELTYTKTRLDNKLVNDILNLKYRLIIITGNAGDGKTAFIRKVEGYGTDRTGFEDGNGTCFNLNGLPFESNYDGSQDEGDNANQQVLEKFFNPFYGLDDYSNVPVGRIIAINEGRLVDFLMTHEELKPLYNNIEEYFYKEGHVELLPGLMVINLNLRSVTARSKDEESLLHSQIKKLTAPELWGKCEKCPIADKCFIRYNVTTFQDSSASDEIISRWEWLLRTVVYKRELHITMRDLRSFIAFMLTRDCSCDQVKQMLEHIKADNIGPEFYWQYYYFNLPSKDEDYIHKIDTYFPFPGLKSTDRLVQIIKDTDIARVSMPAFDRDLFFKEKTPDSYLVFAERKQSLLKEFNACNIIPTPRDNDADDEDNNDPSVEATVVDETLLVARHQSFIRHQYFEGASSKDPDKFDFMRRLPYQSIGEFYRYLTDLGGSTAEKLNEIKSNIAIAISRSEGCISDDITKDRMLLKCNHIIDPLSKSYRAFDVGDFELFVNRTPHLVEYIEYESDSLVFRHKTDNFIQLTISLDLFEMLEYIRKGFSPSVNDLQGKFIELQIFKNLLESRNYSEILVTKNNKKFYVVRLKEDNTLSIKLIKQEEDDNQSK